jgi:hypothetical protein
VPTSDNFFDDLPAYAAVKPSSLDSEFDHYIRTACVRVPDVLVWWYEQRDAYPRLSRMAIDYHSIPATSVDVERVFSKGRILLSHIRSRLSVQSTRALMCVGAWSKLGFVKDKDVIVATRLPEIEGDEEDLDMNWDNIE